MAFEAKVFTPQPNLVEEEWWSKDWLKFICLFYRGGGGSKQRYMDTLYSKFREIRIGSDITLSGHGRGCERMA